MSIEKIKKRRMDQANNDNKKEMEKREDETIDRVARALIAIAREIVRKEDENKKAVAASHFIPAATQKNRFEKSKRIRP